jgi:hypothetical protein
MKIKLLTMVAALGLATSTYAAELTGEVGVEVTKNANDKVVATTELTLGIEGAGGAFGNIELLSNSANTALEIDGYSIGTIVNGVTLSFGKQEDLFADQGLEVIGGETLAAPADDVVSVRASMGALAFQVGFEDVGTDMSELENVQLAYGTQLDAISVEGAVDYNFNTEDTILSVGAAMAVGAYDTALVVTHANDFAYELSATRMNVTGFINGDEADTLQNIGVGYTGKFNDIAYFAEAGYNLDTEEFTPAIGVSFQF